MTMPHPARGHINPMMNLCKSLASKRLDDILVAFVVRQEWLGLIGSDTCPKNITFATISDNIVPSQKSHGTDPSTLIIAVMTKTRAPFEQILDGLNQPVTTIITDAFLLWAINVPVVALGIPSASVFTISYHADLFAEKGVSLNLEDLYIHNSAVFFHLYCSRTPFEIGTT